MILRHLGAQGIAGIAAALCLVALLLIQKGETRHWRKQSRQFEQLYSGEQAAFAGTVANYRAAAEAARAADRAAAERVRTEQQAINQGSKYALEIRLADARARAQRLRLETPVSAADRGAGRTAALPRLPAAAGRTDQAAGKDGLSETDQRARRDRGALGPEDALIATEQAIQLDELINWIKSQAVVKRD